MNTHASLATLRQHLENLFPGKWVRGDDRQKTLLTGLSEIDHSLMRGLARQRITEWSGPVSSGKTSVLRAIVSNWCASGFDVAYVDTENRLIPADWIFLDKGNCGARPVGLANRQKSSSSGKFWGIRNLSISNRDTAPPGASRFKKRLVAQEHLWAADELIRSNAFDVVILDLGASEQRRPITSRIYARLQNSLAKSKAALILLRDGEFLQPGWGCYAQIGFRWGLTWQSIEGLNGAITILPSIHCSVIKDGLAHTAEVQVISHVTNSLFTHPQVPDRRTPKT